MTSQVFFKKKNLIGLSLEEIENILGKDSQKTYSKDAMLLEYFHLGCIILVESNVVTAVQVKINEEDEE